MTDRIIDLTSQLAQRYVGKDLEELNDARRILQEGGVRGIKSVPEGIQLLINLLDRCEKHNLRLTTELIQCKIDLRASSTSSLWSRFLQKFMTLVRRGLQVMSGGQTTDSPK